MAKLFMFGFFPYSALVLLLTFSPALNQALGPAPAIIFNAFWCTYALIAAAIALYTYDVPVARWLGPSVKLQRLMMRRSLNLERRL